MAHMVGKGGGLDLAAHKGMKDALISSPKP